MHFMPAVQASTVLPVLTLTLPTNGQTISGIVLLQALADAPGVADLQFRVNGSPVGSPITSGACSAEWNTAQAGDGPFTVTAVWHDAAGVACSDERGQRQRQQHGASIWSVSATNLGDTSATINWVTGQTASIAGRVRAHDELRQSLAVRCDARDQSRRGAEWSCARHDLQLSRAIDQLAGTLSVSGNNLLATGSPPGGGGCVTPDPFANMGGGTCWNGGWLPPGMAPPNCEVRRRHQRRRPRLRPRRQSKLRDARSVRRDGRRNVLERRLAAARRGAAKFESGAAVDCAVGASADERADAGARATADR